VRLSAPECRYDWPSLLGFFFVAFCRYRQWSLMRDIKRTVTLDAEDGQVEGFVSLDEVRDWAEYETMTLAIDSLLVYMKVSATACH
jgi:hypothetical protein